MTFYHKLTTRFSSSHKNFKTKIRGSFKIGERANTGLNTSPPLLYMLEVVEETLNPKPSYPKNHIGMEKGKYGERGGGKGTRWGGKGKG
jgi:hypothetical protein